MEAIGVDDPLLDAEVIAIADEGYRRLGLRGYRLDLSSIGCRECRPAYREVLREFLAGLPLDEATAERATVNPLRVLDDKRADVQALLHGRAAAAGSPVRRLPGALQPGAARAHSARGPLQPQSPARAGPRLLHPDDVRVRPSGSRRAVRHRGRRPLRRAHGVVGRPGHDRDRFRPGHRPDPVGLSGGGSGTRWPPRGRRLHRPAGRGRPRMRRRNWPGTCVRPVCGSTWPMAVAA